MHTARHTYAQTTHPHTRARTPTAGTSSKHALSSPEKIS
eukprot:COSAG03_NODE_26141_length_261_cov_0.629630_1_plen_38_part_10